MAIGIDPTVDFAFKKLLGSPDHPAITLHFLNAVLAGSRTIASVEFINPFMEQEFEGDKLAILDVRARDDQGRSLNIEMQTTAPGEFRQRLAYYMASQYVGQMREGDRYQDLMPSIGICVLQASLFPESPHLHLDFQMRERRDIDHLLSDSRQIHLLELPKYTLPSDNEEITNPIEQWAYFFQRADGLTRKQLTDRLSDSAFIEAAGVLEMIARDPKERALYEARLKLQRDEQSRLDAAEERGEVRGETRGHAHGRIQLLQQLLGQTESNIEELRLLSLNDLASMERDLQDQLRNRG